MNFIKKHWFSILCFVLSLLFYMLPNIFFKIDKEFYYSLEGPHLPPIVFIIVWTVIYILMSIFNAYYINLYKEKRNNSLIKMFVFIGINYIANILYVPLFFMIQNLFFFAYFVDKNYRNNVMSWKWIFKFYYQPITEKNI